MRLLEIVIATILNKFIPKFHNENCWKSAIPNSECRQKHRNLKVLTGEGFTMKTFFPKKKLGRI
jgi:hypothetical protein